VCVFKENLKQFLFWGHLFRKNLLIIENEIGISALL